MNRSCEDRIVLRLMDLHPSCIGLAVNILGYIIPVLAVIVTIVNLLIVIVFMKPRVRSHTTFILTLIACVDIMDMICPTVVYVYHYMFGYYEEFLTCRQVEWAYILGKICVDMLNMISLWLTVLLAYIRCRCIKSPFVARHVHSFKRIVIYITCVLSLAISIHLPSFFIFDFQSLKKVDPKSNVTRIICGILEADGLFLKSCSKRKLHVLLETLLDSLIPCVFLVYFNFVMLITLRKAKQSRTSLRQSDSGRKFCYQDRSRNIQNNAPRKSFNCETLNAERSEYMVNSSRKLTRIYSCFKCQSSHTKRDSRRRSSDLALDKLDRESRRTSWLILVVSTIILVHEIPIAVANIYALVTHTNAPLPLSINGCYSTILLLWQFITYPTIFLIYAGMSSVFRSELWKILTCLCNYRKPKRSDKVKSFLSPCSVRKATQQNNDAGPSRDVVLNDSNVFDSDSGSHTDCNSEMNTLKL